MKILEYHCQCLRSHLSKVHTDPSPSSLAMRGTYGTSNWSRRVLPQPNFSQPFQSFPCPNPSEWLTSDYVDVFSFCFISIISCSDVWWEGLCHERDHRNDNNHTRQLMERRNRSMANIHTQYYLQ